MPIITDQSWQEYLELADRYTNGSTLVHGIKSPLALRHAIDNPMEPTKDTRVGHCSHSLLEIGPLEFANRFAVMPPLHMSSLNVDAKSNPSTSKNTTAYKQLKREWMEEHADYELLDSEEYDRVKAIVDAVFSDPLASEIVARCRKEVTVTADLQGIPCRGRIDLLDDGYFCDLKTTANIEMWAFGRTFANFKYGFKLAFYRELLRANGVDPEVELITVENKPPHDVAVVPVPEAVLDNEVDRIYRVLHEFDTARKTGRWPGVAKGQRYELAVPNWSMDEEVLF